MHMDAAKKIAGDKEWFDIVYAKKLKFTKIISQETA